MFLISPSFSSFILHEHEHVPIHTVKERLNREHALGLESQSKIQSLEREQIQLRQEKQEVTLLLAQRTSDYNSLLQNKATLEGELKDVKLALAVAQSQAGRTERQEEDLRRTMQVMGWDGM